MEDLFSKLIAYGQSDFYPYHMPGHKRRSMGSLKRELASLDITEIDGFDNLHQPEGILEELQQQAARLYGAEESFFLVNGSTCGILSAISAAVPEGGHILLARNCHKSAYHAAYLRNLKVTCLYPEMHEEFPIYEGINAAQVAEALEQEPDIQVVLIVSPTYEGRIADVAAIAQVVHDKGLPLIVDEAHGAHLGFGGAFAQNSNQQGADLVIHSVHKTLPAMTQTALLHVNGTLIDRELLKRFLRIYQSSSPSYVLMASIGNVLQLLEKEREKLFPAFARAYQAMVQRLEGCRVINCLPADERQDIGKLVIFCKEYYQDKAGNLRRGLSGQQIYQLLRECYHLQPEMAAGNYCLAMFTVADGEEAYDRMIQALLELDEKLWNGQALGDDYTTDGGECHGAWNHLADMAVMQEIQIPVEQYVRKLMQGRRTEGVILKESWDAPKESIPLEQAVGRRAGEFINLYPPGAPIRMPGEILTEELLELLQYYEKQEMNVQGILRKNDVTYVSVLE